MPCGPLLFNVSDITMIKRILILGAVALIVTGCTLKPGGTKEHEAKLEEAGAVYQKPFAQRTLPEIPTPATWEDVLRRALLANGDLEAAYWEWNAAVAEIDQDSAYPNSNINLGFDYMFTRESMKAWDRTTVSGSFDPSTGGLMWPSKISKMGDIAFARAQAAASRFENAKFQLQLKVLTAYLDLALMEEKIRLAKANLGLTQLLHDTSAQRVQTGGAQQDFFRVEVEHNMQINDLQNMEAQASSMRAMLNGMLARDAQAALSLPPVLPPARHIPADDAALIAAAVDRNPRLAELAHQVQGRTDAIELAKRAYIPDFSPTAAITGNVAQSVGAMVMIPTNLPKIRGAIREAKAMLQSSQAMARQTRSDTASQFVASLYALRNAERQERLLLTQVLPAAERINVSNRPAYAAGTVNFIDMIEGQRTVLEVREAVAEARIEREKRLAELEALAGVDVETLSAPTTAATTAPTTALNEKE